MNSSCVFNNSLLCVFNVSSPPTTSHSSDNDDNQSIGSNSTSSSLQTVSSLPAIELGFIQVNEETRYTSESIPLYSSCWHDWDGGKIGGKPLWLTDSQGLPSASSLQCQNCGKSLVLLVQLYAPIDPEQDEDKHIPINNNIDYNNTFHRMLYVFTCISSTCVNIPPVPVSNGTESSTSTSSTSASASSTSVSKKPSIVVLRSQLPRKNPFLPYDGEETIHSRADLASLDTLPSKSNYLCYICGLPGPQRCSICKNVYYCSRNHQLIHWKNGHKDICNKECTSDIYQANAKRTYIASQLAGAILPEHEIIIETEPSKKKRSKLLYQSLPEHLQKNVHHVDENLQKQNIPKKDVLNSSGSSSSSTVPSTSSADSENLSIKGLTRKQLTEITGAQLFEDGIFQYFQSRIACEPAQCIRYCRWPPVDEGIDPVKEEQENLEKQKQKSSLSNNTQNTLENIIEKEDEEEDEDNIDADNQTNQEINNDNNNIKNDVQIDDEELDIDSEDEKEMNYEPFGAPLWISSQYRPYISNISKEIISKNPSIASLTIPPCTNCGAPRKFEFQIMPQVLNYITKDYIPDYPVDLDFGTIAIYTCTNSCNVNNSISTTENTTLAATNDTTNNTNCYYIPEFAWIQPADNMHIQVKTVSTDTNSNNIPNSNVNMQNAVDTK